MYCFNYLSGLIEELSQSYNQKLKINDNIDLKNSEVQNHNDKEMDNAELILSLRKRVYYMRS